MLLCVGAGGRAEASTLGCLAPCKRPGLTGIPSASPRLSCSLLWDATAALRREWGKVMEKWRHYKCSSFHPLDSHFWFNRFRSAPFKILQGLAPVRAQISSSFPSCRPPITAFLHFAVLQVGFGCFECKRLASKPYCFCNASGLLMQAIKATLEADLLRCR